MASVIRPGLMRHSAAMKSSTRCQGLASVNSQPNRLADRQITPMEAVMTDQTTNGQAVVQSLTISSSMGSYTNMKGTMYAGAAARMAAKPDCHMFAFARLAAANTARATGGVIAERIAK